MPRTGVLDPDILYRIRIAFDRRITHPGQDDYSLGDLLAYLEAVREKYLNILRPAEVGVTIDHDNRANLRFIGFPGGSFSASIATDQSVSLRSPKTAAQPSNGPTRTCAYAKFRDPGGARRGVLPRRPGPRGGPLDRLRPGVRRCRCPAVLPRRADLPLRRVTRPEAANTWSERCT
jgi:hypothetical protein